MIAGEMSVIKNIIEDGTYSKLRFSHLLGKMQDESKSFFFPRESGLLDEFFEIILLNSVEILVEKNQSALWRVFYTVFEFYKMSREVFPKDEKPMQRVKPLFGRLIEIIVVDNEQLSLGNSIELIHNIYEDWVREFPPSFCSEVISKAAYISQAQFSWAHTALLIHKYHLKLEIDPNPLKLAAQSAYGRDLPANQIDLDFSHIRSIDQLFTINKYYSLARGKELFRIENDDPKKKRLWRHFSDNFMVIYEDWIKPTLQSDFRFAASLLKSENFQDISTKIVLNTSLPLSVEIAAISGAREFLDSHNVLFTLFLFDLSKYRSLKTKVVEFYENLTNFSKLSDLLLKIENLFFCEETVLSSFSSNQKVLDIWYLRVKPLSLSLEDLKKWLVKEKIELNGNFVAISELFLSLRIQKIVINRLFKYDDARYYEGGNYLFSIVLVKILSIHLSTSNR